MLRLARERREDETLRTLAATGLPSFVMRRSGSDAD